MMAMPVDNVMHAMVRACGLNLLVEYFDVEACNIWEGYVTQGRGVLIEHIRFLGLWDIKEGVT